MSAADNNVVEKDAGAWRRRALVLIPLLAFLALAALFMFRLGAGDPSRIPSAVIGHVAPPTNLPRFPRSSATARLCQASTARSSRAR